MKLVIRRAEPAESRIAADIVKAVFQAMPEENKIWFSIDAVDKEAARIASGEDLAWLAVDEDAGGKAAGVFIVEFPGDSPDNMGHYAGFSEEQLQQVVHMDTAAVLPEYRGQKLQKRLMERAEAELKDMGYRYLMCTVHPENPYSRQNIVAQGYEKIWQGLKYGGKLRDVMLKRLEG